MSLYQFVHLQRECAYCGKPHRDGKCLTYSRRTPYIKKNSKKKKIKDSQSHLPAKDPAKLTSELNQVPTVDTCAVNSEIKFSHPCH